jgi:Flp pilus assembly pilin Flp
MQLRGSKVMRNKIVTTDNTLARYWTKFYEEEDGQAVTEYGAVIAFISCVTAAVFSLSHGGLYQAVSLAFGSLVTNLNHLSNAGAS